MGDVCHLGLFQVPSLPKLLTPEHLIWKISFLLSGTVGQAGTDEDGHSLMSEDVVFDQFLC